MVDVPYEAKQRMSQGALEVRLNCWPLPDSECKLARHAVLQGLLSWLVAEAPQDGSAQNPFRRGQLFDSNWCLAFVGAHILMVGGTASPKLKSVFCPHLPDPRASGVKSVAPACGSPDTPHHPACPGN